jgi:hypothetical protein
MAAAAAAEAAMAAEREAGKARLAQALQQEQVGHVSHCVSLCLAPPPFIYGAGGSQGAAGAGTAAGAGGPRLSLCLPHCASPSPPPITPSHHRRASRLPSLCRPLRFSLTASPRRLSYWVSHCTSHCVMLQGLAASTRILEAQCQQLEQEKLALETQLRAAREGGEAAGREHAQMLEQSEREHAQMLARLRARAAAEQQQALQQAVRCCRHRFPLPVTWDTGGVRGAVGLGYRFTV